MSLEQSLKLNEIINSKNPEKILTELNYVKSNGKRIAHLIVSENNSQLLKDTFLGLQPDHLFEALNIKNGFGYSTFELIAEKRNVELFKAAFDGVSADVKFNYLKAKNVEGDPNLNHIIKQQYPALLEEAFKGLSEEQRTALLVEKSVKHYPNNSAAHELLSQRSAGIIETAFANLPKSVKDSIVSVQNDKGESALDFMKKFDIVNHMAKAFNADSNVAGPSPKPVVQTTEQQTPAVDQSISAKYNIK